MRDFFADFHIHVGISETGKWVKIPTSRQLTLRNILHEASARKGMEVIGIVDALSPLVRDDFNRLVAEGLLTLDNQGGYRYKDELTLILGAEIETTEPDGGTAHTLIYLPDISTMDSFATVMAKHIRNIHLSSQNAHMSLAELVRLASGFEAAIVPAHIFTPHKGLYGACTRRMADLLGDRELAAIAAVELGLSADSFMADRINELATLSFLTNSDAHSTEKIAREYNIIRMENPSFSECLYAFRRQNGRGINGNYGLDPRLGKYHRTSCLSCGHIGIGDGESAKCPKCGGGKFVNGVLDRIDAIADYPLPVHPDFRPHYQHQVPLNFIPGVGAKAMDKLLTAFGTEMRVLHNAGPDELIAVVGERTAAAIMQARSGQAEVTAGGGGVYGKLAKN